MGILLFLLVQCFYDGLLGQVVERHVDVGGREHVAVVENVGLDRVWTEVGARVFRVGLRRTLLVNRLAVGHCDAILNHAVNRGCINYLTRLISPLTFIARGMQFWFVPTLGMISYYTGCYFSQQNCLPF